MNKNVVRILVVVLLLQMCSVTYANQQEGKQEKQLPAGNLTLAFDLDSFPNYDKSPVQITASYQTIKNGVSVLKIRLSNFATEPVTKVKLLWIITEKQDKNKILFYREIPFIIISSGLKNNCSVTVEDAFFSFSNIYNDLVSNNFDVFNGDFEVSFAVSEVIFEDGLVWKRDFFPLAFPQPTLK